MIHQHSIIQLTYEVSTCKNLTFTELTMVAEWGLVCDRNWQSKVETVSKHPSMSLHTEQAIMSVLMYLLISVLMSVLMSVLTSILMFVLMMLNRQPCPSSCLASSVVPSSLDLWLTGGSTSLAS